jgi:hypothetical protein
VQEREKDEGEQNMSTKTCRDKCMVVRTTTKEYAAIRATAKALDTTVSSLVRALATLPVSTQAEALNAVTNGYRVRTMVVFDRTTYPRLIRQLRAWGNQYNQATRALNTVAAKNFMSQEDTIETIGQATAILEKMEAERRTFTDMVNSLRIASAARLD